MGVVTYASEMKTKMIGVDPETIEKYNVVSDKVAMEMAKGVRIKAGTTIGLGITGIAGPGGGDEEHPVGLVYVGISDENGEYAKEFRLGTKTRGRATIREFASGRALDMLRRHLEEN